MVVVDTEDLSSISSVKSRNDLWESLDLAKLPKDGVFRDQKFSEQIVLTTESGRKKAKFYSKETYNQLDDSNGDSKIIIERFVLYKYKQQFLYVFIELSRKHILYPSI